MAADIAEDTDTTRVTTMRLLGVLLIGEPEPEDVDVAAVVEEAGLVASKVVVEIKKWPMQLLPTGQ